MCAYILLDTVRFRFLPIINSDFYTYLHSFVTSSVIFNSSRDLSVLVIGTITAETDAMMPMDVAGITLLSLSDSSYELFCPWRWIGSATFWSLSFCLSTAVAVATQAV